MKLNLLPTALMVVVLSIPFTSCTKENEDVQPASSSEDQSATGLTERQLHDRVIVFDSGPFAGKTASCSSCHKEKNGIDVARTGRSIGESDVNFNHAGVTLEQFGKAVFVERLNCNACHKEGEHSVTRLSSGTATPVFENCSEAMKMNISDPEKQAIAAYLNAQ